MTFVDIRQVFATVTIAHTSLNQYFRAQCRRPIPTNGKPSNDYVHHSLSLPGAEIQITIPLHQFNGNQ